MCARETMIVIHPPPLRVLIVEDEPRLRELLAEVVPDMGFPVTVVRSAEEAERLMEAEVHTIVLLDLHLPGENGMEFFQRLRNRWPQTQVIIVTGHGDLDAARQAIHLDVVDFIRKPCHLRDVEVALDRARRRLGGAAIAEAVEASGALTTEHTETLAEVERRHILSVLDHHNGNRTAAAADLGISRRTLHYRLKAYQDGEHSP